MLRSDFDYDTLPVTSSFRRTLTPLKGSGSHHNNDNNHPRPRVFDYPFSSAGQENNSVAANPPPPPPPAACNNFFQAEESYSEHQHHQPLTSRSGSVMMKGSNTEKSSLVAKSSSTARGVVSFRSEDGTIIQGGARPSRRRSSSIVSFTDDDSITNTNTDSASADSSLCGITTTTTTTIKNRHHRNFGEQQAFQDGSSKSFLQNTQTSMSLADRAEAEAMDRVQHAPLKRRTKTPYSNNHSGAAGGLDLDGCRPSSNNKPRSGGDNDHDCGGDDAGASNQVIAAVGAAIKKRTKTPYVTPRHVGFDFDGGDCGDDAANHPPQRSAGGKKKQRTKTPWNHNNANSHADDRRHHSQVVSSSAGFGDLDDECSNTSGFESLDGVACDTNQINQINNDNNDFNSTIRCESARSSHKQRGNSSSSNADFNSASVTKKGRTTKKPSAKARSLQTENDALWCALELTMSRLDAVTRAQVLCELPDSLQQSELFTTMATRLLTLKSRGTADGLVGEDEEDCFNPPDPSSPSAAATVAHLDPGSPRLMMTVHDDSGDFSVMNVMMNSRPHQHRPAHHEQLRESRRLSLSAQRENSNNTAAEDTQQQQNILISPARLRSDVDRLVERSVERLRRQQLQQEDFSGAELLGGCGATSSQRDDGDDHVTEESSDVVDGAPPTVSPKLVVSPAGKGSGGAEFAPKTPARDEVARGFGRRIPVNAMR